AARCAPEVGWWWNPAESGRGFFVESQGGIFYMAGYFYDVDGRPTWLVAGGQNGDPYSFSGQLQGYTGGQTLFGAYTAPSGSVDAGAVSVHFTDDAHGTITWPGGVIPIQRHVFGGTEPAFQPLSGWWWNPAESGRGFSVELQGDTLFVASFMYDDAGKPVWYLSAGPMTSPMHYEGPWLRYANGQTLTGSYHPPDAPQTAGTLAIDFTQADKATITVAPITGASGQSANATPEAISPLVWPIEREFRPVYDIAQRYDVRFTYKATYFSIGVPSSFVISGLVTFVYDDLPPLPGSPPLPDSSRTFLPRFDPVVNTLTINYVGSVTSPALGLQCQSSGHTTVPLPRGSYELEISTYGPYMGKIVVPKVPFTVTSHCVGGGVTFDSTDQDDGIIVEIPLIGSLESDSGRGLKNLGQGVLHIWSWGLIRE
ncbi:MAG: hypothetical protein ABI593_15405, partial [Betaproteobacteria bacterium]